jgi:hypothetical protein
MSFERQFFFGKFFAIKKARIWNSSSFLDKV